MKIKFFILFVSLLIIILLIFFNFIYEKSQIKVFLIVIDGAEWKVINPLIEEGKLPNFKKLKEEGSYGYLISPTCLSPPEWTSIATGKKPEKHGINNFTKNGRLVTSLDVKSKFIWELIGESGKKVGVYNWIFTWPAQKVNGFMVATWATDLFFSMENAIYPSSLEDELKRNTLDYSNYFNFSINTIIYLFNRFDPDFFGIGETSIRVLQGMLWKYWEPEKFNLTNETEIEMGRKILSDAYQNIDNLLGKLMEINNSVIFLVSDHGFHSLPKLEYTIDYSFQQLLMRLKIPLHVCHFKSTLLEDTEAIEFCSDRKIGEEEIVLLSNLTYANSQKRVFTSVQLINDNRLRLTYNGTLLKFNSRFEFPSKFYLTLSSNNTNITVKFFEYSGGHLPPLAKNGVILVRGRMIKSGYEIKDAVTYDITPTILYLMGIPIPQDMDGKVLKEMIKEDYLAKNPIIYTNKSSQK
jgi:predicted AlkP superfamily phosphohydrolase/phosphomutase